MERFQRFSVNGEDPATTLVGFDGLTAGEISLGIDMHTLLLKYGDVAKIQFNLHILLTAIIRLLS